MNFFNIDVERKSEILRQILRQIRRFSTKKGSGNLPNPLKKLMRPAGFEPATYGFVVRQNIDF